MARLMLTREDGEPPPGAERDVEQAEHVAQLLTQGHAFVALVDALRAALDDPPDVERARHLTAGLLLWGWGQGYYPQNPGPMLRARHQEESGPGPREAPPTPP